jgi:hypothetical protein
MDQDAALTVLARRLWLHAETVHAVTYFAPEARDAFEQVGLRGFWRGYFAGRAAPMGAVSRGTVVATFYNFHPDFVARSVPDVWTMVTPAAAIKARLEGAGRALSTIGGDDLATPAMVAGVESLHRALGRCHGAGRPLFEANAHLDWPPPPYLALWHAATLLREHRGDGHVAALVLAELDGCEAHVLRLAVAGGDPDQVRGTRGWSDDDWVEASDRLRSRGLLDDEGVDATAEGRALIERVESETDRLAALVLSAMGDDDPGQVIDAITPLATAISRSGMIPYPNPMGLPPLD